ncbi:CAP domain-containing protein [Solibacillus merdavium]|uniref:LysM peptidoglycan-binding domain-containing protein n=1 Tax=Solibacillus merdavium TaxID=2762218 RepID=A0ABR8XN11_9BACL|nr:CAP domain-containing protein [Solibacillus merdavium]MBD8033310.1 LysM peptidoglycan-binding domain-containing protein [Solibacillus merdavium]
MLKKSIVLFFGIMLLALPDSASAATYTVKSGDTLWKIASKNQIGLSELISLNPTLKNPDMIYVGDKITISENEQQAVEEQVVNLVNKERAKEGLAPLTMDWELARVAKYKSQDMHDKKYFSHTSPTYGSPFDMMKKFDISYKSAGENIAQGQKSATQVMDAWMNSSGHRANIMNAQFTHIGVGYVKDGNYWTQMFIKK